MYRTGDPRFRRRLNEIESTLERANETAQSSIYIFSQTYVKPCFESLSACFLTCLEAGCPCVESQRSRPRRQRGRSRVSSRPELSFDFYDDWDNEESDALIGWEDEEQEQLAGSTVSYGAISNAQPERQKPMQYPRVGRKTASIPHESGGEAATKRGPSFVSRFFGGKSSPYIPSAAGLQEHPGAPRKQRRSGDASLDLSESAFRGKYGQKRSKGRKRSETTSSGHTTDSLSSRGDIFPSDDEDDAVPLDDEFAMVLERRNTQSGEVSGNEAEVHSSKSQEDTIFPKRAKRPSVGRNRSSRRTVSGRSTQSSDDASSRRSSQRSALQSKDVIIETQELPPSKERKMEAHKGGTDEEQQTGISLLSLPKFDTQTSHSDRVVDLETATILYNENAVNVQDSTPLSQQLPGQRPTPSATDDEAEEDETNLQGASAGND